MKRTLFSVLVFAMGLAVGVNYSSRPTPLPSEVSLSFANDYMVIHFGQDSVVLQNEAAKDLSDAISARIADKNKKLHRVMISGLASL